MDCFNFGKINSLCVYINTRNDGIYVEDEIGERHRRDETGISRRLRPKNISLRQMLRLPGNVDFSRGDCIVPFFFFLNQTSGFYVSLRIGIITHEFFFFIITKRAYKLKTFRLV